MKRSQNYVKAAVFAAFLALLLTHMPSIAQPTGSLEDFMPATGDMTTWLLTSIFGDWKGSTQVPMIGGAMAVYNAFALAFGTMMFSYMTIVGTLNSAQDGELLGKKWSTMWVPLRFTVGVSLMIPMASGYSTIQHFILWLALAGGGAASQVWAASVSNMTASQTKAVQMTPEYLAATRLLMKDIIKYEICNSAFQTSSTEAGQSVSFISSNKQIKQDPDQYGKTIQWGDTSGNSGKPADACGSMRTAIFSEPKPPTFLQSTMMYGDAKKEIAANTLLDKTNVIARGHEMIDAQAAGINAAANSLRPVAEKIAHSLVPNQANADGVDQTADVKTSSSKINAAVDAAAIAYRDATMPSMTAAAGDIDGGYTKFMEASVKSGWLMAGTTFFQMAQIRTQAAKLNNSVPVASSGPLTAINQVTGLGDSTLETDIDSMNKMVDNEFNGDTDDRLSFMSKWAVKIGKLVSVDPSSNTHALVQIKDNGDAIIFGTEVIGSAMTLMAVGAHAADQSLLGRGFNLVSPIFAGFKKFIEILTPAAWAGLISSFGVGITMAFVLPLLPFTLVVGSIVGWIMAVFSAVVAAPIWIAGHLHPEGDDIAGKGIGGYMILLETVTRPIFIIFGLIGAFLMLDPVLKLVSLMFMAATSSIQGDSITGIVSVIVIAVLYVGIVFTTVRSILSLVHVLSETAYRWIGGAHAGMEQAREFNAEASTAASNSSKAIQGAGGAMATGALSRAKAAAKKRNDESGSAGET